MSNGPTTTQALEEAMKMRELGRIYSKDGQLYAAQARGKSNKWNIRRVGDNNSSQNGPQRRDGRVFATIETRCKRAVMAMLEALAPFHRRDEI